MNRTTQNYSQCFTLEDLDIRGQVVQLEEVWQALHEQRGYSAQALRFLGELSCVAVLIGAGLKYPGRAALQIQRDRNRSNGTLLAIVDCTQQLGLRGMVNALEGQTAASFSEWVGDGTLAITLSRQSSNQMYQSIVPLSGLSVAECFEHYFDQSEQLPTHLWLAANEQGAGALLLQKLPGADEKDADGWARIEKLAASVSEAELISLPAAQLLQRLFYEEDIRLHALRTVQHDCARNPAKVEAMLQALGAEEIAATLRENGNIVVVRDEICNHEYRFDAAMIERLFSNG